MKKKHQKYVIRMLERVIEDNKIWGKVSIPTLNRINDFMWKERIRQRAE